jgi:hypothetical protein
VSFWIFWVGEKLESFGVAGELRYEGSGEGGEGLIARGHD